MKWRFDDIETFLDVMESGSITASAARLNLSKSVVSKRISDLEAALGTSLFQRSPKRLAPTETAATFFERVKPLVMEINEAAESAAWGVHGLRGRLRIAAPITFGSMHLGPVIAAFARLHPELELAVEYDDRTVDLVRNGIDVAIRIGVLKDSSLIARKICSDPRVVCCSPGFAATHGVPRTVAELASFDCIDYAHVHTSQMWQFENPEGSRAPISVAMRGRIVVNNGEAMRDLAIAGLGIILSPMFIAASALEQGLLVPLLPGIKPLPYDVSAIYPPTRHVAPKVRAFVDHVAKAISPRPPWLEAAAAPSAPLSAAP